MAWVPGLRAKGARKGGRGPRVVAVRIRGDEAQQPPHVHVARWPHGALSSKFQIPAEGMNTISVV